MTAITYAAWDFGAFFDLLEHSSNHFGYQQWLCPVDLKEHIQKVTALLQLRFAVPFSFEPL
jgi:hypothetical protein